MPLAVGDRVRIRLDGHCRESLGAVAVDSTDKRLVKHEVDRMNGHRPEAEGKLGRIIKITPGGAHAYAVLYINRMGQNDPIIVNKRQQVMGGDYAASELGSP